MRRRLYSQGYFRLIVHFLIIVCGTSGERRAINWCCGRTHQHGQLCVDDKEGRNIGQAQCISWAELWDEPTLLELRRGCWHLDPQQSRARLAAGCSHCTRTLQCGYNSPYCRIATRALAYTTAIADSGNKKKLSCIKYRSLFKRPTNLLRHRLLEVRHQQFMIIPRPSDAASSQGRLSCRRTQIRLPPSPAAAVVFRTWLASGIAGCSRPRHFLSSAIQRLVSVHQLRFMLCYGVRETLGTRNILRRYFECKGCRENEEGSLLIPVRDYHTWFMSEPRCGDADLSHCALHSESF